MAIVEDGKPRFGFNVPCLCGAAIGAASLFAAWITFWVITPVDHAVIADTKSGLDFLNDDESMEGDLFASDEWAENRFEACQVGVIVFSIGTAIAFLTPIGGFAQLAGVLLVREAEQYTVKTTPHPFLETELGFTVALFSLTIVLWSFVFPIGLDRRFLETPISRRLLTILARKPT